MYLDNSHVSRTGFRFAYKGGELLAFAKDRLAEKIVDERNAREKVISLTRDPSVSPTDPKVNEAKREITTAATVVEELSVYVTEFARDSEREYNLSLGDVVFFGLITPSVKQQIEAGIKPSN